MPSWRRLLHTLSVAAFAMQFAAPLAAAAQPPQDVKRIAYLSMGAPSPAANALGEHLRARGWVEGQNIAIERRYDAGRRDQLPTLAAQLVDMKPSVIVVAGTPAAVAAKQATTTIPIVMTHVADPVRSGLVASLARPGGNVTGMAFFGPESVKKQLELLREATPRVTTIAVMFDPANQAHVDFLAHDVPAAGAILNLKIHPVKVDPSTSLSGAFVELRQKRVDALMVYPLALKTTWPREVADLAIKHQLPTLIPFRASAEQGALLAFSSSQDEQYQRAAGYVDRLLKGAKPADLPIEQPTRFELVVNLKTAKALGLTLPPSLLLRADQVIE